MKTCTIIDLIKIVELDTGMVYNSLIQQLQELKVEVEFLKDIKLRTMINMETQQL